MIIQWNVKSTTQCTMYVTKNLQHNVRYKLHYNAVACLVVTERQVAEANSKQRFYQLMGNRVNIAH